MIIARKIFQLVATENDLWPSAGNSIPHKEPSSLQSSVRNGNGIKSSNRAKGWHISSSVSYSHDILERKKNRISSKK